MTLIQSVPLTWMKNWSSKLDMPEMSRTLSHSLTTRLTFEIPVCRPHAGVVQATDLKLVCRLIDDLRMLNLRNRIRFLIELIDVEQDKSTFGRKNRSVSKVAGTIKGDSQSPLATKSQTALPLPSGWAPRSAQTDGRA